jgi:hypothetical protein
MMKSPKNGVLRIKRKNGTITKKVYRNGYLQMTYFRCPISLTFRSKMVNDANQDLCGGWYRFADENKELVRRLREGLKPMISMPGDDKLELDTLAKQLKKEGYAVKRYRSDWGMEFLDACHKGKLSDLFDMERLIYDYSINVAPELGEEIRCMSNTRIEKYLGNFKWDDLGWLTGLILGYPIENTISIIYGGSDPL